MAEEVRSHLAALGLRTFAEAVGRTDLLHPRETDDERHARLDLSPLLARFDGVRAYAGAAVPAAAGGELDDRLATDAAPALESTAIVEHAYEIVNSDRTVGARLGGLIGARYGAGTPPGRVRARFTGTAGQSFGAFLAAGVELDLEGEANDYVGKSMSGGRIAVSPPPATAPEPCLVGNTALYGATGGELYCAGRAGERFAVRNSGAVAVVEGVGDHGCEYMTNGTVVVLGSVGRNFAAGMTGGRAFVHDPDALLDVRLNGELVGVEAVSGAAAVELRALVEQHVRHTGSERAGELLRDWDSAVASFVAVTPRLDVARLESAHEGTEGEVAEPAATPARAHS